MHILTTNRMHSAVLAVVPATPMYRIRRGYWSFASKKISYY